MLLDFAGSVQHVDSVGEMPAGFHWIFGTARSLGQPIPSCRRSWAGPVVVGASSAALPLKRLTGWPSLLVGPVPARSGPSRVERFAWFEVGACARCPGTLAPAVDTCLHGSLPS